MCKSGNESRKKNRFGCYSLYLSPSTAPSCWSQNEAKQELLVERYSEAGAFELAIIARRRVLHAGYGRYSAEYRRRHGRKLMIFQELMNRFNRCRLCMSSGADGAGKTTFIKRFAPRELALLDFINADQMHGLPLISAAPKRNPGNWESGLTRWTGLRATTFIEAR